MSLPESGSQRLASGRQVIFDVRSMEDVQNVLRGVGPHADTITGWELRYIQEHWDQFQKIVTFVGDKPW